MYNLVFTKESDGIFVSVFDQKGNEIYNSKEENEQTAFENIKTQKFKIDKYITSIEDYSIDYRIFMVSHNTTPKKSFLEGINNTFSLISHDGDFIANESFHGYGLNRYLHRQFLNLNR